MANHYEKLAKILRVDKKILEQLEEDLQKATGKDGTFGDIVEENEKIVTAKLDELGLGRHAQAHEVYDALISKVEADDIKLFEFINIFSLRDPAAASQVAEFVKKVHPPQRGYFLKLDKAREFLMAEPPKKILQALGYDSVAKMLAKEDILEVYSALRFLEDGGWLNNVFFKQYERLTPADFEEREIVLKALDQKWGAAAERFVAKKYHNVSHLKELGVIFVIPIFLGISGETLRLISLLFHYLNEVQYYSSLFAGYGKAGNGFAQNILSLLRGDVLAQRLPEQPAGQRKARFLVVQRYLAKDDENDWRLFEPHINPEALHWHRAEKDVVNVQSVFPGFHNGLDFWRGLGWVGDFFPTEIGINVLVSFNLIDTVMSLVKQRELVKYLYHHQESLWNRIFAGYFGEEELEKKSREYILKGWFEL